MPNGNGAPTGLAPWEHVQWALLRDHEFRGAEAALHPDLAKAMIFCMDFTVQERALHRLSILEYWEERAIALEEERKAWVQGVPPAIRIVAQKIHGPLLREIIHATRWPDTNLVRDFQLGFPFIGKMPEAYEGVHFKLPKDTPKEISIVTENLEAKNKEMLRSVRETDYAEDLYSKTDADVEKQRMTPLRPLTARDVKTKRLTRRFPVRERHGEAKEWRTRPCDHYTECEMNPTIATVDAPDQHGLDIFIVMLIWFLRVGLIPRMWKRDVSGAFRCIPIFYKHLKHAFIVFKHVILWIAGHLSMPFGSVASVHSWHRYSTFVVFMLWRLFKIPAGRWVDDFFGGEPGLEPYVHHTRGPLTPGYFVSAIMALIGTPMDPEKDNDEKAQMIILGADIEIIDEAHAIDVQPAEEKTRDWTEDLVQAKKTGTLDPGMAGKFAGRFTWTTTVAARLVGRAWIKPFYAQQYQPLPGNKISSWLDAAMTWWIGFLVKFKKRRFHSGEDRRPHTRMWTDAAADPSAGERGTLCAVVERDGEFHYTTLQTPQWLFEQLLPREDNQIGCLETFAVALGHATFEPFFVDALTTAYVDNDGTLGSFRNGSGRAPEVNIVVGHFWWDVAALGETFWIYRVESAANIADGPTRGDFTWMRHLKASFWDPILPKWMADLWAGPPRLLDPREFGNLFQ